MDYSFTSELDNVFSPIAGFEVYEAHHAHPP